ncbi:MAG: patatin-like phospholipase family protein [Bradymonadaceae bacterium]|nr:patatin-like phospholipase family protein [Lujinxingiaceae bacterium]
MRLADALASAPFTLCMSSGFFGFYAHAGMLSALIESDLRPARVVGSSAGALIGGCYATGLSTDALRELLVGLRRTDFWDPSPGAGLLSGRRMDALLREALPVHRFDELQTPFACSAWRVRTRQTEVLDKGDLPAAIRASAAFPGLFQPVRVAGGHYLDGGIADRPAFAPLAAGERTLYHHLASKSPWRRGEGTQMLAPSRADTITLDLGELPRLGPFRLEQGGQAMDLARERTLRALELPAKSQAAWLERTT